MEKHQTDKSIDILLAEDCVDDVARAEEAFSQGTFRYKLHVVNNGVEAIRFLRMKKADRNYPIPDLVFLDLNLPGKNGFEVLQEMKEDKELKSIPVIVLSNVPGIPRNRSCSSA